MAVLDGSLTVLLLLLGALRGGCRMADVGGMRVARGKRAREVQVSR